MLPPTEPAGLRALKPIEPTSPASQTGDLRREAFDRLNRIEIGKSLQAQVLSVLRDGTYLLKIADTAVQAALPREAQVGGFLNLKMVASQPRPTFLLLQSPFADTATLSSAAKLIGSVLQQAGHGEDGTAALLGKTAMLSSPSAETPEVAAALRNTLSASGLFYESHLGEWVSGARTLSDIRQEPQAQFGKEAAHPAGAKAEPSRQLVSSTVDIVDEWSEAARPSASAAAAISEPVRAEAAQLINLQLQTLEQHKFVWQGELWPGQKLEWEVREEEEQAGQQETEQAAWSSTVRFELPELGPISANIYLESGRVRMQLRAAREETAGLLRGHGTELADALDAAGSPLDGLTVRQDEEA